MKVEIIKKERIFDHFFKIDAVDIRHEKYDGSMTGAITRFSFERGESVAVLPFFPEERAVLLIEQFRYPGFSASGGGWLLEIVAGSVDRDEALESIATQELFEESGYSVRSDSLIGLCSFLVSPGGSSERVHLYLTEITEGNKKGEGGGNDFEGEDIKTIKLPLKKALKMIEDGGIEDGKTILALMMLEKRLMGR